MTAKIEPSASYYSHDYYDYRQGHASRDSTANEDSEHSTDEDSKDAEDTTDLKRTGGKDSTKKQTYNKGISQKNMTPYG